MKNMIGDDTEILLAFYKSNSEMRVF